MAQMIMKRNTKGDVESVILKDVTLFYTCIQSPRAIYDDRNVAYEKARKEFTVDVAGLSEDDCDTWDEIFGKQPSKKHSNEKFRSHYKLEDNDELPDPNGKKQYTLKLGQKAQNNAGEPISEKMVPRVLMVEGGKAQDITFTTLIGNGSKGDVMVRCMKNDYGQFSYLYRVKVTELVEFASGNNADELEFLGVDEVELAEMPKKAAQEPAKESNKAEEPVKEDPDFDDTDF